MPHQRDLSHLLHLLLQARQDDSDDDCILLIWLTMMAIFGMGAMKRSQNLRIAKMHFLTLKQLSGRFMSFFIVNFVEEGRGERGWHI